MNTYIRVLLLLTAIAIHQSQCSFYQTGIQLPDQITIPDLDHQVMMDQVAQELNTTYLSIFKGEIKDKYSGIIWGFNSRPVISLPVRLSHSKCPTQINIIFKIDTASPLTTLTDQALDALYNNCPNVIRTENMYFHVVHIAGKKLNTVQSFSHFKKVNILGADIMNLLNARLKVQYSQIYQLRKVQLYLNANIEQELLDL